MCPDYLVYSSALLTAHFCSAAPSAYAAPESSPGHAKKGVGTWNFTGVATALSDANVAWVYDWASSPSAEVLLHTCGCFESQV